MVECVIIVVRGLYDMFICRDKSVVTFSITTNMAETNDRRSQVMYLSLTI